jgi:hypothetical protein
VNDADLDVLEGRLDFMISKFRRVKLLRLTLQKQELEDTKKCRLCQVPPPLKIQLRLIFVDLGQ